MEELKKQISDLEAKVTELETALTEEKGGRAKDNDDAQKVITELQGKLNEKSKEVASSKITVTHDKKKYVVAIGKFRHEGVDYEAKDLHKFPKVIAALLESESAVLIPA